MSAWIAPPCEIPGRPTTTARFSSTRIRPQPAQASISEHTARRVAGPSCLPTSVPPIRRAGNFSIAARVRKDGARNAGCCHVVGNPARHHHGVVGRGRRQDAGRGPDHGRSARGRQLERAQAEAPGLHDLQEAEAEMRRHQAQLQHLLAPRPHVCLRRGQEEERAQEGLREGARGATEYADNPPARGGPGQDAGRRERGIC